MPKVRRNRFIEIVPSNQGCLKQCTYCKSKHEFLHLDENGNGDLVSWTPDGISERVRQVMSEGVVDTWLSWEATRAYGSDLPGKIRRPQFLCRILQEIPPHVRFMTNP